MSGPIGVMPSHAPQIFAKHLSSFIARIDDCTDVLNEKRAEIEDCVRERKPVPHLLRQTTSNCLATLRYLQTAMKQHHMVCREAQRVVRRTPTHETKYDNDHSRSSSNLPVAGRRRSSTWHQSPQISALAHKIDNRVRYKQNQFKSRERKSPV